MSSSYWTKHVQQVLGSLSLLCCISNLEPILHNATSFGASQLFLIFFLSCFLCFYFRLLHPFVCPISSFFRYPFLISPSLLLFSSLSSVPPSASFRLAPSFLNIACDWVLVKSLAHGKDLHPTPEEIAVVGQTKYFNMVVLPLTPAEDEVCLGVTTSPSLISTFLHYRSDYIIIG